jgi:hypothetical protein
MTATNGAIVEAVAARHGDRLSDRALAGGGAELPTLMSYAIEKRLSKRPRNSARRDRSGRRARKRRTTHRPPARWCRC